MVWILNRSNEVNMTVEYEGKEYYAEKEDSYISCKGCVFEQADVDYKWCACKDDKMKQDCCNEQIVWKEVSAPMLKKTKDEEPKFTVEQVLLAAKMYTQGGASVFYPEAAKCIEQYLVKHNDPDYKLYLELKSKYESWRDKVRV